jgi:thiol-disulfide isomerase/thioredoxin
MAQFVQTLNKSLAAKVASAYYQPVNPDWKQPDTWRDSIIAAHYFDYFNPADSFYLFSNILPEKMDMYLSLRNSNKDVYGRLVYDETIMASAAQDFLEKTKPGQESFEFCLNYFLKKFNKEHKENAFLSLNDRYLKNEKAVCEPSTNRFNWARERAGILRGVQIGSIAPDFNIAEKKLNLHELHADYTLIVFWASWCPHCAEEVPRIKKNIEELQKKHQDKSLSFVFVSLDNEEKPWKDFLEKNELTGYVNLCEFKGWNGQIGKSYNVYATPSMFLLDKNKKIIAKPESAEQLINVL